VGPRVLERHEQYVLSGSARKECVAGLSDMSDNISVGPRGAERRVSMGLSDRSDTISVGPRVLERRVLLGLCDVRKESIAGVCDVFCGSARSGATRIVGLIDMSDNISVGPRGAQRRAKGNCRGSERHE
jgi:hypothetical protein